MPHRAAGPHSTRKGYDVSAVEETSKTETPEPMSQTAWGKAVKTFSEKVREAMGAVYRLEVSTAQAALVVGGILADVQDSFRAQGLGDDFSAWAQKETGKSGSWVSTRIQAAKVIATLPETRKETPIEDLAALHRVSSHEAREAILTKVRDAGKMTGVAATKAIREEADAYLLEKNPDRATRKAERAQKAGEEKASKMRDAMRPKIVGVLKSYASGKIPADKIAETLLLTGCRIGESFGEGSASVLASLLAENDPSGDES